MSSQPLLQDGSGPVRVLVIDDNVTTLELFRKILTGKASAERTPLDGQMPTSPQAGPNFLVDTVTSGEEGCQRALDACHSGQPFAVAFVDIRIPGGWDGLRTIEALWQVDPNIQVVICTAYSDHTWDEIVTHLGHSDQWLILRKPFEIIEVLQLASALSDKWRLQVEHMDRMGELGEKVVTQAADLSGVNRRLRMLSQCNLARLRAGSEGIFLDAICHLIVDVGGYVLAWIGYANDDEQRSVRPVACVGDASHYVDKLHLSWGDDVRRCGIGGTAIREGRTVVVQNICTAPAFVQWRDAALACGFASAISVPLINAGRIFGVLGIYASDVVAFGTEEVELIEELADDLSFSIAALRDAEARQLAEQELEFQTNYDALTGLANNTLFRDRVGQAIRQAVRDSEMCAVIMLDLDRFRAINDSLGLNVGDAILKIIGSRIAASLRAIDTVARVVGDKFGIVVSGLKSESDSALIASKLQTSVSAPMSIDGQDIYVSASLGISLYPRDSTELHKLIVCADAALHNAKSEGDNVTRFFTPAMNEQFRK
jgi:diguanylate cyclase (GGDEF)-like protein